MISSRFRTIVSGVTLFSICVNSATVSFKLSARQVSSFEANALDKPDPYVSVFYRGVLIGRSETLDSNQYPIWDFTFTVNYDEKSNDQITVEVTEDDPDEDDLIGIVNVHPKDLHLGVEREIMNGNLFGGLLSFNVI